MANYPKAPRSFHSFPYASLYDFPQIEKHGGLLILFVFKRIFVQLRKVKKLRQCHIEGNGNLMQGFYPWISGDAANDIIQCGLLNVAHASQFIDGKIPLLA